LILILKKLIIPTMKNLFFSLILFFSFTLNVFGETIYNPSNFLQGLDLGNNPKVETVGKTVVSTYKDGTVMTIMDNAPNPQIVTWKLSNGAIYQTKAGTSAGQNQYVQKVPIQKTTTDTNNASDLNNQNTNRTVTPFKNLEVLDQIAGNQGEGLSGVLNQLFWGGLVVAVILSIFMIVRGGLEYMTSDIISSKETAKNRIKGAIGGLMLSFSTILILNTINPGLTNLSLKFPELKSVGTVELKGEELALVSADRELYEETFVGPPAPGQAGTGTNTSGPIPTSYFGGPEDVRTKGGYALHYCDRPQVTPPGSIIGEYAESTRIGGTEYRWCYALNSNKQKIPYPEGRASAHGGYYEPTAFGYSPLMRELSGDYIAYPLPGSAAAKITGLPNVSVRNKSVTLTFVNGTTVVAAIRDTGPHGSIAKLDVSPSLSKKIQAGGGLKAVTLN
jgi:hypothetical protein